MRFERYLNNQKHFINFNNKKIFFVHIKYGLSDSNRIQSHNHLVPERTFQTSLKR